MTVTPISSWKSSPAPRSVVTTDVCQSAPISMTQFESDDTPLSATTDAVKPPLAHPLQVPDHANDEFSQSTFFLYPLISYCSSPNIQLFFFAQPFPFKA